MQKWLMLLWLAVCVVCTPVPAVATGIVLQTKQTSKTINKKIESLTVERLLTKAMRVQKQSTLKNRIQTAIQAERLFREAGIKSDKMILAMLANAWHESGWNPTASSGSCVGFFQLSVGGMGKGSSKKQLKTLSFNVKRLMASTDFKNWVAWCKKYPNKSCGEMSFRFASYVERCAKKHRHQRFVTAEKWHKMLISA